MSSIVHSSVNRFSYCDEAFSHWSAALERLKEQGVRQLQVPVFWGAHEPWRGGRDFSKSPRLRLERFLQLAHEAGLTLEIELGFPLSKEALPPWTCNFEPQSLVPVSFLEGEETLGLTRVPSPHGGSFLESFLSFCDEVLSLLTLYRGPGGPITSLQFVAGRYECDQGLIDIPEMIAALEERYRSFSELNTCYGTNFPSFEAAASSQGMRIRSDRRPWLYAFDYRLARSRLLGRLRTHFHRIAEARGMGDLTTLESGNLAVGVGERWQLAIDATLFESSPDGKVLPFAPFGAMGELSANAFRLGEYLSERCATEAIPFTPLSHDGRSSKFSAPLCVVVAGKYLSGRSFQELSDHVTGGGTLFFPFGLPQYGENLTRHEWVPRGTQNTQTSSKGLCHYGRENGQIVIPLSAARFDDTLWPEVIRAVETLAPSGDQV